jgi:general secretion pathway protein J
MSQSRGLTLVEMLIALFIMAVLAVLSYRTVAAMIDASQHVDQSGKRFERLADTVDLMTRDLSFVIDQAGDQALRGDGGADDRPGEIRFPRSGSAYQTGVASGPVTVGYRLQGGTLEKLIYPPVWMLNGQPEVRPLLEGQAKGLRFRFRDRSGAWHSQWPDATVTGLPSAVEITLSLIDGSNVVRMVAIP